MRHPILQRLIVLLLLAGVTASLLPFGRDAVMRERWVDWVKSFAPEAHHEAVQTAVSEVLAQLHPGAHALVQALVLRDDADPAWFGLNDFSPDAVRRLEQQMAAVPTTDPVQSMLVQGNAATPTPSPSPVGLIAAETAGEARLLPAAVLAEMSAPPAAIAALIGTRISPRAP